MKPLPQNRISHRPSGDQRPSTDQLDFPKTDYTYQTALPQAAAATSPAAIIPELAEARTFRTISRSFFDVGAMREYVAEALFFVWISLTAAWPLGLLVRQLSRLTIRH